MMAKISFSVTVWEREQTWLTGIDIATHSIMILHTEYENMDQTGVAVAID
ncbi:hypothetical protein L1D34_27840 [Vibrio mediterranei]|nr:hypothetical protein [Vibrio mediterranei]MCG9628627.1 hypothetical protein [Vibrio mediterranei]